MVISNNALPYEYSFNEYHFPSFFLPYCRRVIRGIETSVDDLTDYTCDVVKHLKVAVTPNNNYTMTLPSKSRQRRAGAAQSAEDRWVVGRGK